MLDAVVYCKPVTCIQRWKTATSARIKIQPWLLKFIENFLFVERAIIVRRVEASINRRIIIVTGLISFNTVFVATNDAPQKIIARRISR